MNKLCTCPNSDTPVLSLPCQQSRRLTKESQKCLWCCFFQTLTRVLSGPKYRGHAAEGMCSQAQGHRSYLILPSPTSICSL